MPWRVKESTDVPPGLRTRHRREANLLWYGPSRLLVARETPTPSDSPSGRGRTAPTPPHPPSGRGGVLGVVRVALRDHETLKHGLLTDLIVETPTPSDSPSGRGGESIADALIRAGEELLRKERVRKIDAIVVDGVGLSDHFLRNGFWASRKTVVVEWELPPSPLLNSRGGIRGGSFLGVTFEETNKPDPEELADFILSSYQPYWQWWRDDLHDRLWERVDYPAGESDEASKENAGRNRARVLTMLQSFNTSVPQRMVIARTERKIIGLCDAQVVQDSDTFDWGVLLTRDHPGKGFGQALLFPALQWLREQGLQKARVTTTSGLDDYDPTVYLYTQNGGKILGEFLNLVKRAV